MRRLSIIGAALIALILLADTVAWYWATGVVARETDLWVAARRAQGWAVRMGPPTRSGWPWAARIKVADVAVQAPFASLPGGASFKAEMATIGVNLLVWRHVEVFLAGAQRLQLGASPEIAFTSRLHVLSVDLPETGVAQAADIRIEGVDARIAPPGTPEGPRFAIERATARVVSAAETLRATLDAKTIDLPPSTLANGVGPRILQIAIDLALTKLGQATPASAPASWRDAGGSLAVRSFDIAWGSFVASGSANLHLDAALQPEGTGDARLSGTADTLDALASAKLIAPRAAMAAKAVLQLMQQPQPDGPPIVQLPLTLQDRTLRMGRIPLTKLPELTW